MCMLSVDNYGLKKIAENLWPGEARVLQSTHKAMAACGTLDASKGSAFDKLAQRCKAVTSEDDLAQTLTDTRHEFAADGAFVEAILYTHRVLDPIMERALECTLISTTDGKCSHDDRDNAPGLAWYLFAQQIATALSWCPPPIPKKNEELIQMWKNYARSAMTALAGLGWRARSKLVLAAIRRCY